MASLFGVDNETDFLGLDLWLWCAIGGAVFLLLWLLSLFCYCSSRSRGRKAVAKAQKEVEEQKGEAERATSELNKIIVERNDANAAATEHQANREALQQQLDRLKQQLPAKDDQIKELQTSLQQQQDLYESQMQELLKSSGQPTAQLVAIQHKLAHKEAETARLIDELMAVLATPATPLLVEIWGEETFLGEQWLPSPSRFWRDDESTTKGRGSRAPDRFGLPMVKHLTGGREDRRKESSTKGGDGPDDSISTDRLPQLQVEVRYTKTVTSEHSPPAVAEFRGADEGDGRTAVHTVKYSLLAVQGVDLWQPLLKSASHLTLTVWQRVDGKSRGGDGWSVLYESNPFPLSSGQNNLQLDNCQFDHVTRRPLPPPDRSPALSAQIESLSRENQSLLNDMKDVPSLEVRVGELTELLRKRESEIARLRVELEHVSETGEKPMEAMIRSDLTVPPHAHKTIEEQNRDRYREMCMANNGILYRDEMLEVSCQMSFTRSTREGNRGAIELRLKPTLAPSTRFTSVRLSCTNADRQDLVMHLLPMSHAPLIVTKKEKEGAKEGATAGAEGTPSGGGSGSGSGSAAASASRARVYIQPIHVEMVGLFDVPPTCEVDVYLSDNSVHRSHFTLPLIVPKFLSPATLTPQQFLAVWWDPNFQTRQSLIRLSRPLSEDTGELTRHATYGGAFKRVEGMKHHLAEGALVAAARLTMLRVGPRGGSHDALCLMRCWLGTGQLTGVCKVELKCEDVRLAQVLLDGLVPHLGTPFFRTDSNATTNDFYPDK
ncbi:unnamed protein product [Vitrella brassicaformis CCMP3155]|uniref:Uncharacterized protein n=1 Tax=Vitrella brassicaformis (strain CCMP3155) TaxID=1169540 RepID=A0A0G4EM02_VITBC|nr:unnamed protein product [Vitrella brassicaformis CCMP3155]|eukprot:CEL98002.1 unnamed protein product [Vitrella brassicaformis CCMP3155]